MLRFSKIYLAFSGLLVAASILVLSVWGLNLGIEFTGGSLMNVQFKETTPEIQQVRESLRDFELRDFQVKPQGEDGFIIRTVTLSEQEHQELLSALSQDLPEFTEASFQSIGPVIGDELKNKSFQALLLALLGVVLYVSWTFRRASEWVRSWQYGLVVLLTLFHDVIITVGIFAVLGHFLEMQIGVPFVAAVLTVLGYSVNDTIVVFDRIRERVMDKKKYSNFQDLVERSLRDTVRRSINTSVSTLIVLLALFIFGGASLFNFLLALITGVVIGTYSSLFVAPPLLLQFKARE